MSPDTLCWTLAALLWFALGIEFVRRPESADPDAGAGLALFWLAMGFGVGPWIMSEFSLTSYWLVPLLVPTFSYAFGVLAFPALLASAVPFGMDVEKLKRSSVPARVAWLALYGSLLCAALWWVTTEVAL